MCNNVLIEVEKKSDFQFTKDTPYLARYGVSIAKILEKIDQIKMAS